MNKQTLMLALVIVFGAVLVAGLIVVPVIDEANARSPIAGDRNKGQQGDIASGGKRQGGSSGGGDGCPNCG